MNPVSPMQYVYVLQGPFGKTYTGCTNDLKRRINEHIDGKSTYTKNHGPYKLIYYEACIDSKDAYHRERYLKSGSGKNFIKNRLRNYLQGGLTG
jgi:putative endonuclease